MQCYCSVAQSCPALWDPLNCSMPDFPVLHYLPEFAQIHVHSVSDAIQPLVLPSLALNLSQHQSLFQGVGTLHQVAKVLELQHQSFQWIFRVDFLKDWLVWFPCCPRDSQDSSPAPQFKSINYSAFSLLYGPTLTPVYNYWKNHSLDNMNLCQHTLSRFVIASLPRSECLFISWLQSLSPVILKSPGK